MTTLTAVGFLDLMQRLAHAWSVQDTEGGLDCFTPDAITPSRSTSSCTSATTSCARTSPPSNPARSCSSTVCGSMLSSRQAPASASLGWPGVRRLTTGLWWCSCATGGSPSGASTSARDLRPSPTSSPSREKVGSGISATTRECDESRRCLRKPGLAKVIVVNMGYSARS